MREISVCTASQMSEWPMTRPRTPASHRTLVVTARAAKPDPALPDRPPRGLAWGNRAPSAAPLLPAHAAPAPAPLRAPRGTAAPLDSLIET